MYFKGPLLLIAATLPEHFSDYYICLLKKVLAVVKLIIIKKNPKRLEKSNAALYFLYFINLIIVKTRWQFLDSPEKKQQHIVAMSCTAILLPIKHLAKFDIHVIIAIKTFRNIVGNKYWKLAK